MQDSVILLSGGFDSLVLLKEIVCEGRNPVALFFNYGQSNAVSEYGCAKKSCDDMHIELIKLDLPVISWSSSSLYDNSDGASQYIEMRNLIFISYALSLAEARDLHTVFVAFTNPNEEYYKDSSPDFLDGISCMLTDVLNVEVVAPFIDMTKIDLAPYALKHEIKREDFFSCNLPLPEGKPCGECGDCFLIEHIYSELIPVNLPTHVFFHDAECDVTDHKFIQTCMDTPITCAKLYINDDCQFSCSHCFIGSRDSNRLKDPVLSVEEWVEVLQELKDNEITHVDFFGKEPLFNADVFSLMETCRSLDMTYSLITNGFNATKYLKELVEYLPSISISVESFEALTYRTSNSNLKNTITTLISNGLDVSISLDLSISNKDSAVDLIRELYSMGVRYVYVKPLIPMGDSEEFMLDQYLSGDSAMEFMFDLNSLLHEFLDLSIQYSLRMYHVHLAGEARPEMMTDIVKDYLDTGRFTFDELELEFEFFCSRFNSSLAISPDGHVMGCASEYSSPCRLEFGKVLKEPMYDIICDSKYSLGEFYRNNHVTGCYFSKLFYQKGCNFNLYLLV